ncbi:MAG TPA: diguanylate cyclase, partial [Rhodocyclaceae bacterium]|nr:diguanylate cyclase [Rhodocyclaceae bacterium]
MTKVIGRSAASGGAEDIEAATRGEIFSARRATAIALATIVVLVGLAGNTQREQIRVRETERAEHLARTFEFHVHHELQGIDDLLRQMREMRLDTPRGFAEAITELRAGELGQRSIQFGFIDLDGRLRHSTVGVDAAAHVFLGDEDYFKVHLDPGRDRLFIGRPRPGGFAGTSAIQFSRRYADAGGRLQGVVLISMPATFLTDSAGTLGLRPDDVATILRRDGYLLSRTPVMPDPARAQERLSDVFMAHFAGRDNGLFEEASPVDQAPRLIAFRQTTEFPVLSIVGQHTRQRDLELRQAAWRHLSLAGVVLALLLAYHLSHERSLRRNGILRRERELERRHLTEAQAIANLGSWQLNIADHSLYGSDEVYRIFGLAPGATRLSYDDFLARVHPDDLLALSAAVGKAREDGVPYSVRHRIVRPDGAVRHVLQRGQVVLDAQGLVGQMTGTLQDITLALEAETRLLEAARSDRLARAVFDGVLQPMIVLSAEGRLIDVNPAFEQTFAVAGDDLRGHLLAELENSAAGAQAFANRPSRLFQPDRADQPTDQWEGDIALPLVGSERVLSLSLSGIRDASGRVEHYVGIYTDVTQRRRREDSAAHQARHDPLTGLPNRQYALERLARSVNRSRRKQTRGVVIFIDLDRFKEINDTHGHDAGDEVLRVIARRFRSAVRQEDMVARLGGDEFIALIEEVDHLDVVRRVAEALRAAAAEPVS